ncbi:uncharacterized protein LOC113504825 [Trichoplusia ni]|uniref:Uncharacterized protein LOC113504825 n=1 Tax=Trichoplusia ni TaxID=7111 RepID=A0A7E5WS10_TRINI|nr:uncharacterized protein LOC113504825 [Trichoplusia ni]
MGFKENLAVILVLIIVQNSNEFRFMRRIQAIGSPYYMILMSLGACKEKILYLDQKIWAKLPLNRVLDIYYKNENDYYKVSRVEIKLVINNTSSFAISEDGVGFSEFRATLFLPTHLNFVIYSLTIYTCNTKKATADIQQDTTEMNPVHLFMPFILSDNKN